MPTCYAIFDSACRLKRMFRGCVVLCERPGSNYGDSSGLPNFLRAPLLASCRPTGSSAAGLVVGNMHQAFSMPSQQFDDTDSPAVIRRQLKVAVQD